MLLRAGHQHPPLSSIRQPLEKMGAKACEMLVAAMGNKGSRNAHADVPFDTVERSSVVAAA